ncbi:YdcF family protein [Colwelliaceae bacterium 6441]
MTVAVVVLGSPNDEKGNLLPIAISRAKKAAMEYQRIANGKILCTGGFGQHFNLTSTPHGHYLQKYLMQCGIPPASFLDVALSAFTLEDATLALPILEKNAINRVVLVTSDFHMERAKLIFNHVMPDIEFEYAESETLVSKHAYQTLIQHEKNAIKRELANFMRDPHVKG